MDTINEKGLSGNCREAPIDLAAVALPPASSATAGETFPLKTGEPEKVEPNTGLLLEVDQPEGNTGTTSRTGWLDRFEDWINFLKDVVKILAE